MSHKRQVEVFSAGCSLCDEAIQVVQSLACDDCEFVVHDMADPAVDALAKSLAGC